MSNKRFKVHLSRASRFNRPNKTIKPFEALNLLGIPNPPPIQSIPQHVN